MSLVSYQTITLSKGKHDSPEDGACAMELAAMLAGEPLGGSRQQRDPLGGRR
jgi:hypothetical protein